MLPQAHQRNIKWNVTDLLYPTPESYPQSPEVTYVHFALFFLELFYVCIHKYTAINNRCICLYKPDQTIIKTLYKQN